MRSIPACAGEPSAVPGRLRPVRVYPRVCGGTAGCSCGKSWSSGLSPRVRGNRRSGSKVQPSCGSIPACAGEPSSRPAGRKLSAVYPRVCGGTKEERAAAGWPDGLSPRVRGNLMIRDLDLRPWWSIPACAGEPQFVPGALVASTVYPRVCGGTPKSSPTCRYWSGLSPRVRGNPAQQCGCSACSRSIPACAGEPSLRATVNSC